MRKSTTACLFNLYINYTMVSRFQNTFSKSRRSLLCGFELLSCLPFIYLFFNSSSSICCLFRHALWILPSVKSPEVRKEGLQTANNGRSGMKLQNCQASLKMIPKRWRWKLSWTQKGPTRRTAMASEILLGWNCCWQSTDFYHSQTPKKRRGKHWRRPTGWFDFRLQVCHITTR